MTNKTQVNVLAPNRQLNAVNLGDFEITPLGVTRRAKVEHRETFVLSRYSDKKSRAFSDKNGERYSDGKNASDSDRNGVHLAIPVKKRQRTGRSTPPPSLRFYAANRNCRKLVNTTSVGYITLNFSIFIFSVERHSVHLFTIWRSS